MLNPLQLLLLSIIITSRAALALEALPGQPPVPADNPMTPAKIGLGKQLYFDPRISINGKISCNSCHNVSLGGEDNRPFSLGVDDKKGGRSAPTVWNAAFMSVQFWDGRAATLEDQAKGPMINPVEMGNADHEVVVARLKGIRGYVKEFKNIFGGDNPITIENVVKAIASYERTLLTPDSPFDLFMKGKKDAMKPAAQRGMQLIQTVGCTTCHLGPNFAGPPIPAGQGWYQKFPTYPDAALEARYHFTDDLGRYETTKKEEDKHMWRVPTWRNVALTAPYFHNGSVTRLEDAVKVMAKLQLNKTLKEDEVKDIVAFLKSLTGKRPKQVPPVLPK